MAGSTAGQGGGTKRAFHGFVPPSQFWSLRKRPGACLLGPASAAEKYFVQLPEQTRAQGDATGTEEVDDIRISFTSGRANDAFVALDAMPGVLAGAIPLSARAPHRQARTGRVGNYLATNGESPVAAVTAVRALAGESHTICAPAAAGEDVMR